MRCGQRGREPLGQCKAVSQHSDVWLFISMRRTTVLTILSLVINRDAAFNKLVPPIRYPQTRSAHRPRQNDKAAWVPAHHHMPFPPPPAYYSTDSKYTTKATNNPPPDWPDTLPQHASLTLGRCTQTGGVSQSAGYTSAPQQLNSRWVDFGAQRGRQRQPALTPYHCTVQWQLQR
jgi:hypothetical protein